MRIIRTADFDGDVQRLAKRFPRIEQDLTRFLGQRLSVAARQIGDRIPGSGGAYKARLGIPSANLSARGGLRVIYRPIEMIDVVLCLMLYYKRDREDVTTAEIERAVRSALPSLVEQARAAGLGEDAVANIVRLLGG
jgi:hypothetical protein